jgi:hypothetical protein
MSIAAGLMIIPLKFRPPVWEATVKRVGAEVLPEESPERTRAM